ncbi:MAG: hypothetical protein HKP30_18680 [Myxococcales bacterium]|nr:hypothetical protein [Myxococcales bacterium]
MTKPDPTPDVAAALASLLARLPRAHQPLLIALAERLAAERYRGWAAQREGSAREQLLACAEREEEIAGRIEALHPDAAEIQAGIRADHPDLQDVNRSVFAGRPLAEQFAMQAQGERLGAATWRSFAREADPQAREALLACAKLEEESAAVLEALLAETGTA